MKLLFYLLPILFLLSCSREYEPEMARQEYEIEYSYAANQHQEIYVECKKIRQDFLSTITDTTLLKIWDEEISDDFHRRRYIIERIEEISYLLILQSDSMNFRLMDTVNPIYLKNFNEKNTAKLLDDGLNKVILQYVGSYDRSINQPSYNNALNLPKIKYEAKCTELWKKYSTEDLKTLGDFQINKEYLYCRMTKSLKERLNFYVKFAKQ